MTAPNQPNPSGSATQGGLASFAAKTAAQRKAEATAPMKNSLETNFFGSWISNMFGGFFNGVLGLISALVFGLKGISGGLIDLTGALKATDQKADTAINTATGAAQTVVNVQKEVVQKIAVFDIKSPTPLWTALNRTEWPSIPWSEAMRKHAVTVTLGSHNHGENNGTGTLAKTDNTNLGTPVLNTTVIERTMPQTEQWFAFIVIPIDTQLSGLNFYAKGTPTDLRTRLYLMAATGDMVALTPESPNLASLLVSATYTATPTTFDDAIVEAGSIVAVRFRANGDVTILGGDHEVIEPPAGFYPRHLRATSALAAGTVSPTSVTESSLTWTQGFVPYVAVGNNIIVAQPKRFWEDNFDREDAGGIFGIGSSWSATTNVGIRSNDLAFISTSDGLGYALYTKPLTTDYQLHGCRVGLLPDAADSQVAISALMFRCTQNRSSGLRVAFRRGVITLQTIANQTNFTNLVSTSRTLAVGDSIQAQQGEWVDEVFYPDRVLVFHNGVEIIRTDVASSVVPYGPQRRYGGLGQERTPFQNSPRVMDWFESDISDIEDAA